MSVPRMAWWLVLTLFPLFIITLIRWKLASASAEESLLPRESWFFFLFALVPMLVSMLGALLWSTSAVSSELERQSWDYLAVRPHGKTALLLGKYLVSVTWVLSAALGGLTLAVLFSQLEDPWFAWSTLAKLTCLSCPTYSALYLLIGTLFPQRAMAVAVAYSLVFEIVIGFLPALINTLTVQYRLRALLVDWGEISFNRRYGPELMAMFGQATARHHLLLLAFYTGGLLILALVIVQKREYTASRTTDS